MRIEKCSTLMSRNYFYFLIILLYATPVKSQADFRPGYIISVEGDSSMASINFAKSDVCEYQHNKEKIQLTAKQISGFGFYQDRFYSSEIIDGIFTEVLVQGFLSLYRFKESFYIRKGNSELVKIEKKISEKADGGGTGVTVDDIKWRGILKFVLSDCKDLISDINGIKFNETALSKKVVDYNICQHAIYAEYKQSSPNLKIQPGLGFGIGYTSFGLKNGETVTILPTKFSSIDPIPVFILNFYSPKVSNKISIQTELQWKRLLSNAQLIETKSPAVIYHETFLNISFLSIPVYLKYNLPMDRKNMAFYFGFLYDILLNQNTEVTTSKHEGGIITNTSLKDPYNFNLPQFGLSTGVSYGVLFSKINLSAHLKYNVQGLTADSNLKKDGKFDYEFRRSSVLNRVSFAIYVQKN